MKNTSSKNSTINQTEGKSNCFNLIDHIQEVIFQIDLNGKWTFLNQAWFQITGYPISETLGTAFTDYIHPSDKFIVLRKFKPFIENKDKFFEQEVRYLCKDGSAKWISVKAKHHLDEAGNTAGFIGTLLDISERRKFEFELVTAREEAIDSAQAKTAFLANMSHEIRTPMNGIIAMTGLLIDSKLNQQQFEYAKTIKHSADALLELINDILDFSKIEAGKMSLEKVAFDFESLLYQTTDILKHSATKNNTEISVSVSASFPDLFVGDPYRLRQIFTNIIGNAVKFTKNGKVDIHATVISKGEKTNLVELQVKDTGVGISKEALKKIFDAFSQADNSMTRKYGGTGLGLSITERLVRLMNGKILVESELGVGSTFKIQIQLDVPCNETRSHFLANQNKEEVEQTTSKKTKSGKILIAEDNLINQKVFLGLLQGTNYQIDIVENGKKAIEAVRSNSYDLILMDCQMPEMDGYEATLQLRKEFSDDQRIPIIAVTANAMKNERDRCFEVGMDDYVSKPLSGPRLIQAIEKWLTSADNKNEMKETTTEEKMDLISKEAIDQLREMGKQTNSDLLGEVIQLYKEEAPSKLKTIQNCFDNKDFQQLSKEAHHFKSSCNCVGAISMASHCDKIERLSKTSGDPKEIEASILSLTKEHPLVEGYLDSLLAGVSLNAA